MAGGSAGLFPVRGGASSLLLGNTSLLWLWRRWQQWHTPLCGGWYGTRTIQWIPANGACASQPSSSHDGGDESSPLMAFGWWEVGGCSKTAVLGQWEGMGFQSNKANNFFFFFLFVLPVGFQLLVHLHVMYFLSSCFLFFCFLYAGL